MITEQENTIQSVASVQTFSIKSEIRHSNAQGTLVISAVLSFIRPFLEGDFGQQQHREVQESVALKANETLEVHGMKNSTCKALSGKEITERGLKARATTSKCPALNERVTTTRKWH